MKYVLLTDGTVYPYSEALRLTMDMQLFEADPSAIPDTPIRDLVEFLAAQQGVKVAAIKRGKKAAEAEQAE